MSHSEYIIVCPKCSKKLDVGRELRQALLRCKNCQAEFVGSTGPDGASQQVLTAAPAQRPAAPVDDPMAALGQASRDEPIDPEAPSARERYMARKKSPVAAIMIGLFGMIALIIAVSVMMNRASSGPATESGGVGGIEPDSTLAMQTAGRSSYGSGGSGGMSVAAGGVLQQEADSSKARILSCDRVDASKTGMVAFVGEYENVSKRVLSHVRIEVDIVDGAGKKQTLTSETYRLIPSYRTGLWSAECALPASSKVKVVATRSYYGRDPDVNRIGWVAALPPLEPMTNDGTLLKLNVLGTIVNPLRVPMADPQVVIDFFRESGIFVGSVPGTIVKGTRVIGPKANVEFVAALDVSEMQNTDEITVAKVRIVGRKAGR